MNLKKVIISNLFSLGQIDLDVPTGLTLIYGFSLDDKGSSTGAGKSSLAHKAICWGLFGDNITGIKGDGVINIHASSPYFIQIDILKNKSTYRIYRSRKPTELKLHLIDSITNVILKDLTQQISAQTQEIINSILGLNYETWLMTNFFGQGKNISFIGLSSPKQRDTLSQLLPINIIDKWEENADLFCKNKFNDIEVLTSSNFEHQNAVISKSQIIKFIQNKQNLLQVNFNLINNQLILQQKQIDEYKSIIEKTRKQLQIISQTKEIFVKKRNKTKLFHKLIDVLTYRLEKIQQIRVQALILIKELEGLKVSLCNYCGNQLTKEQAKEKKNKRIKIRNKLRNLKVDKLDKFKDFTNKLIQTTRSCFNTVGIELEKYIHIISYEEALKKQQEEYFDKLHQLELEKIPSNDQIKEELKSNKYLLLTELGALIKLNYKILKSLKQTLHDSHIQYEGYLEWKKIFKNDLRHFFFLNVTKFLTNRSNYYIKQLGNPQIKISFVLEENKLGVSVRSETGGENYDMFSGGEQQLTSFAVSLALADLAESQIGSECGFTVLDEPFTNLGAINSQNVIDFINKELVTRKNNIFLISNEEFLQDLIPEQIKVTKLNGISQVEV